MNARERFLASLQFQPVDRPFRWEALGMWPETLERWYSEGLDHGFKWPGEKDHGALVNDEDLRVRIGEFEMDRVDTLRDAVVSGYTDSPLCPAFHVIEIENDGHTRVIQDRDGIIKREFLGEGSSSMPAYLAYPVKSRYDFHNLLARLDPDDPRRFAPNYADLCAFYARRDFPAGLTICGAYGHPRNLFGLEALSLALYDQPALVHEVLEQWADFYCRLVKKVWEGIQYDFVLIWEDMATRNGPLISPRMARELILPHYRRLIDAVRGLGCPLVIVESDGDIRELAPVFLSAGVNALLPFEVQAGMDVRGFRQRYGRELAIIGGLDKRALNQGPQAVEDELRERMLPMLVSGGYIPSLDHTVPPSVSLAEFRYYVERARQMGRD